jgi:hypothetical protein
MAFAVAPGGLGLSLFHVRHVRHVRPLAGNGAEPSGHWQRSQNRQASLLAGIWSRSANIN